MATTQLGLRYWVMIDLKGLSRKLSEKSQRPVDEWYSVLNAAIHDPAFSQMTDGEINHLARSLNTPEQLSWLLEVFRDRYMRFSEEMPFDYLARHVNQSVYTLQDWLIALAVIFSHAKKVGEKYDLDTLVGFAKETIEMSTPSAVPAPFSEIVENRIKSQESR